MLLFHIAMANPIAQQVDFEVDITDPSSESEMRVEKWLIITLGESLPCVVYMFLLVRRSGIMADLGILLKGTP